MILPQELFRRNVQETERIEVGNEVAHKLEEIVTKHNVIDPTGHRLYLDIDIIWHYILPLARIS